MKDAYDNYIVVVREIDNGVQLKANMPNENDAQGSIILNSSQDTENMLSSDIGFHT